MTSAVVDWRRSNLPLLSWWGFESRQLAALLSISKLSVSVRSYFAWIKELTKLDSRLHVCFKSVVCLHVARKIYIEGSARWIQFLAVLCDDLDWNISSLKTKKPSELVEFLQKSAVEHLTTFRQLEVRDFGSEDKIVTTEFEAMYAFKRGDSALFTVVYIERLRMLLYAHRMPWVPLFPEFLQLLDDDIVSLSALSLIADPKCRDVDPRIACISQLTLSLYLMTRCQLKLRHPVTSLTQTLDCIEVAQRIHLLDSTLNQLTLKLPEQKILTRICI